jgi:hypothetical protein
MIRDLDGMDAAALVALALFFASLAVWGAILAGA